MTDEIKPADHRCLRIVRRDGLPRACDAIATYHTSSVSGDDLRVGTCYGTTLCGPCARIWGKKYVGGERPKLIAEAIRHYEHEWAISRGPAIRFWYTQALDWLAPDWRPKGAWYVR